jgi:L-fuconolactonase
MGRDYTPDDLLPELRRYGVDGTVLVQSLDDIEETREYLDLARKHDFIRGVVGWVPMLDPAACTRALDSLNDDGLLVGIRHLISNEPDPDWILQSGVIKSLQVFADRGLVFDAVPMNFRQMESVFSAIEQVPELKFGMNHLARPPIPDQGWEPWATMVTRAAAYPNMALKFSPGMDLVTRWRWSTPMVRRYADHLLACFGPSRILAASNWPVSLLGGSFGEIWTGIDELFSSLSEDEHAQVMGNSAMTFYGLR